MADLELDVLFAQLKQAVSKPEENLVLDSQKSVITDSKKYESLKSTINKYSTLENPKNVEQNHGLMAQVPSVNTLSKKQLRQQRETTSGDNWFNMPKGNIQDPKNKKDLMIIQQRAVLDPKRHYKKDKWKIPKYFQMGTVIEDKSEYFSARLKNKERQQTILQEVLHDKDSTMYFKKKYNTIQDQKAKVIKYKSKKKFKRS